MPRKDRYSLTIPDLNHVSETSGGHETCLKIRETFGHGSVIMTPVRPGMTILRSDLCYNRDIRLLQTDDEPDQTWIFAYLTGIAKCTYQNRYAQMLPGVSDVFIGGYDATVCEDFRRDTCYRIVGVLLEPGMLERLGRRSLEDFHRKASSGPVKMTPGMHAAASALFSESFDDYPDRDLYLEAKALEFLAFKLGQMDNAADISRSSQAVDFPERIRCAAQILEKRMCDPPSVLDLASAVGMSHTALIHGFKDMFASTPYAYLAELRLDKAAMMIGAGAAVTDAAFSVGYSSLSHFARIFKQRYGVNPGSYRIDYRPTI